MGKIKKCTSPEKGTGSEKNGDYLNFTPQADPCHKDSLQQSK